MTHVKKYHEQHVEYETFLIDYQTKIGLKSRFLKAFKTLFVRLKFVIIYQWRIQDLTLEGEGWTLSTEGGGRVGNH